MGKSTMAIFQVQLWPNGKWDGSDYQKVEAGSAREAAERAYGSALTETGSNYKIRALATSLSDKKGSSTVFFTP
jgi:hypothetical protein